MIYPIFSQIKTLFMSWSIFFYIVSYFVHELLYLLVCNLGLTFYVFFFLLKLLQVCSTMMKISILFDISTIFSFFVLPSLVQLISYVLMFLYPSLFFTSFVSVIMQTCLRFLKHFVSSHLYSLCSIFRIFKNCRTNQPKKLSKMKITKK